MVFVNQTVVTPYGKGTVQAIQDHIIVIPSDWTLANNQKPTFSMNPSSVKPFFEPGCEVQCSFGIGHIKSIRDEDGIYVVTPSNWVLADGKKPTFYLNEQSFTKLVVSVDKPQKKQITFIETYPRALEAKAQAKELFQVKKYTEAKIKYLEALEIMRTVETELSNEEKGKFVEMSIFCHSNLAVCTFYENDFPESIRYGQSTIQLIEAIERQDDTNVVWAALQSSGITLDKLREQKVKNLRVVAKSEIKRQNYEEARNFIKTAISFNQNEATAKELNDLLTDVTKKLNHLKKKEKNMWQKAFSQGKEEESTVSSVSPTAVSQENTKDDKLKLFEKEFAKQFPESGSTAKNVKKGVAESKSSKGETVKADYETTLTKYVVPTFCFIFAFGALGAFFRYWERNGRRLW